MDTILPAELVAAALRVVDANKAIGRRISVAESCTGGLVAAALTEIPGSSEIFESGYVTYSNDAKLDMLIEKARSAQSDLVAELRTSDDRKSALLKTLDGKGAFEDLMAMHAQYADVSSRADQLGF